MRRVSALLTAFCLSKPNAVAVIRPECVEVAEAGERYGAAGDGPSLYVRDPEGKDVSRFTIDLASMR